MSILAVANAAAPANPVVGDGHPLPDVVVDGEIRQSSGGVHGDTSFYEGAGPFTHDDYDFRLPSPENLGIRGGSSGIPSASRALEPNRFCRNL